MLACLLNMYVWALFLYCILHSYYESFSDHLKFEGGWMSVSWTCHVVVNKQLEYL